MSPGIGLPTDPPAEDEGETCPKCGGWFTDGEAHDNACPGYEPPAKPADWNPENR